MVCDAVSVCRTEGRVAELLGNGGFQKFRAAAYNAEAMNDY